MKSNLTVPIGNMLLVILNLLLLYVLNDVGLLDVFGYEDGFGDLKLLIIVISINSIIFFIVGLMQIINWQKYLLIISALSVLLIVFNIVPVFVFMSLISFVFLLECIMSIIILFASWKVNKESKFEL